MAAYIGTDIPRHTKKLVRIGIKNFRPFKNWQYFYPSRLNLLIGPNNSGKSTFWEILSLFSGEHFPNQLKITENSVDYREKQICKYAFSKRHPFEVLFTFKYSFSNESFSEDGAIDQFCLTDKVEVRLSYDSRDSNIAKLIGISIKDLKTKNILFEEVFNQENTSCRIDWQHYYRSYLDLLSNFKSFQISEKRSIGERIVIPNQILKQKIITEKVSNDLQFEYAFKYLECFSENRVHYDHVLFEDDLGKDTTEIKLDDLFASTYPSELRREKHSRWYKMTDLIKFPNRDDIQNYFQNEFNSNEEVTGLYNVDGIADYADYYLFNLRMLIRDIKQMLPNIWNVSVRRLDQKSIYSSKELDQVGLLTENVSKSKQPKDYYSKWLKLFNIADELKVNEVHEGMYVFELLRDKEYISLAKLGYGSVQLISLLLARNVGYSHDSGYWITKSPVWPGGRDKLIFLQEPESNFHPKLQSLLADLFVDTIKTKMVSLMIETHSEFIVRKLQYLVARGEVDANDIAIHYFEEIGPNDEAGSFRRIEIRKDGMLKQKFGEGFFDESARWTFELLKIQNSN